LYAGYIRVPRLSSSEKGIYDIVDSLCEDIYRYEYSCSVVQLFSCSVVQLFILSPYFPKMVAKVVLSCLGYESSSISGQLIGHNLPNICASGIIEGSEEKATFVSVE